MWSQVVDDWKTPVEYIDREAANLALAEQGFDWDKAKQALASVPAADVVPIKHGHWIYKKRHRGGFRSYEVCDELGEKHHIRVDERYEIDEPYCSECCKWNESVWLNYCPNCGAKMDGGADNG